MMGQWSLVLEPRHETWFTDAADDLLDLHNVARAGADPQRVPGALLPGGARQLTYLRLHVAANLLLELRRNVSGRHRSATPVGQWAALVHIRQHRFRRRCG